MAAVHTSPPQSATQHPIPGSQTVMASDLWPARHMTRVGLTNWPSIKYEGFLEPRKAWPTGIKITEKAPQSDTAQDEHASPPPRKTHASILETIDAETQIDCRVPVTAAEPQSPEVANKTSDPEKTAIVRIKPQQRKVDILPFLEHPPSPQPPLYKPDVPDKEPNTHLPPNPTPKCTRGKKKRRPKSKPAAHTSCSKKSPYDNMQVSSQGGQRSRMLANRAIKMPHLGDRIVMFTDGSVRSLDYQHPRTAAVTYRRAYEEAGLKASGWIDLSFGVIGIESSNEAEIIAMGEALKALEREVRAYVDATKKQQSKRSQRLQVLIFSDSAFGLNILRRMIQTLKRDKPFTGRDSSVEHLKANVKTLVKSIASTDLELNLDFYWIRGHSGIEGNVRADQLAHDAFLTAKSYFSGHLFLARGKELEIADLEKMKRLLLKRPADAKTLSHAPTSEKPSSIAINPCHSGLETDGSSTVEGDVEPDTAKDMPKSESQARTLDRGDRVIPLVDVLKNIEDLRQEVRDQRKEERQQSEKMAQAFLKALAQLKQTSHATTRPVDDGMAVAEPESQTEKQRKRDVLAATFRRAGKRLRGFGRKLGTS